MSNEISINNITLKIPYTSQDSEKIKYYQEKYSSLLRFSYNRLKENNSLSQKELNDIQKTMNNQPLDTYFRNYAQYEARAMIKADKESNVKSRIFGGKQNFIKRAQNKISKEEFLKNRLNPIYCIGQAHNNGNCKVQILDYQSILFKPARNDHIFLQLKGLSKQYKRYFDELIKRQESCDLPITYKIDSKYIYITFDLNEISDFNERISITDRYFSIDLNPNHIGWSVTDWKDSNNFSLVASGVISIKPLNDEENEKVKSLKLASTDKRKIYYSNKRNYEIIQIAKKLIGLCNHYQCCYFVMEDLNIKSKDVEKGRSANRLINNQWCRNLLVSQIRKRCSLLCVALFEVAPGYSSFIGNLAYRSYKLPDMCLSSIELGRRGYEWNHQYIIKDKEKCKNIIINNDPQVANSITQSLEELGFRDTWESLTDLYYKVKKSRLQYRFQLNENDAVFSKNLYKNKCIFYAFY